MSDLFTYEPAQHARKSDPETSHEAAAKAEPLAHRHCGLILAHLKAIHPGGATVEDIAKATGLLAHQIGKRMSDLERANHAKAWEARKMSSGRSGRVWRAAQ
jgi:predicted ArsR family transcriptional regulator